MSFKLICPSCAETVTIPRDWLLTNDRVACMSCNKAWEPVAQDLRADDSPDEQKDFFNFDEAEYAAMDTDYDPPREDEDVEGNVLDEFVREYLGEYYDELKTPTKKRF